MRLKTFSVAAALAICLSSPLMSAGSVATSVWNTEGIPQDKSDEVKVSKEEADAAMKINQAVGAAAKVQVAGEFLKKYPKTSLRPRIAAALASEIAALTDPTQRLSVIDIYLSLFKEPGQTELVTSSQLDAFISLQRAEDAFRQGGLWLEKHPDDVDLLRRLSVVSLNEAIRGNNKFVEQGHKYGAQAIELMEADKRPADFDAAQWGNYKARWLPSLYREAGLLAVTSGDKAGGRAKLEKAVALKSSDPLVYAMLGQMKDEDYATLAARYQATPAGPEKEAMLKTVHDLLDKVIEDYAQAMALTGDKPEFGPLRSQLQPGLEDYYKFRHNGSTAGLQALIDKYKRAPATP